jgi:MFS transporter, SET family, sugar efflux transporter
MREAARMPVTAMLGSCMFFSGVTFASTLPYGAIVGIETLGMTNWYYAALVSVGSIVGAFVSILIGYVSDRLPDRRILILCAAVAGALGYGLVYLVRSKLAFSIAHSVILPFGFAMFSQNFAFVRVYYIERTPERADFMVSAMRTVFAAAWVVVPPFAGFLATQYSVFDVYLVAALAYVACGITFAMMMTDKATRVAGPSIDKKQSDGKGPRMLPVPVIAGLAGVLIVTVAMRLVGLAMPLSIVTRLGGKTSDVGIYAGIAAAMEIPFMLMWAYLGRLLTREIIIIANGLLFGLYVFLVSQAQSVSDVFWLQGINGIATAALLSVTISYVQDAIKGRVGLSTSLLDAIFIGATLTGAAIFGVISIDRDYKLVLIVAAIISVVGSLVMLAGNLGQLRPSLQRSKGDPAP